MDNKMTWQEMQQAYPDEWLLIVDYESDANGQIISGTVARHSSDDAEVFRAPAVGKDCAFKYTGESTFPGGWRAHANCDHV